MKELLTPYQQRVAQYGIIHRIGIRSTVWHHSDSNFTLCDCLRLGALYVRTEGHVPYAHDLKPENFLPSTHTIYKFFKSLSQYQQYVRAICEEKPCKDNTTLVYY